MLDLICYQKYSQIFQDKVIDLIESKLIHILSLKSCKDIQCAGHIK